MSHLDTGIFLFKMAGVAGKFVKSGLLRVQSNAVVNQVNVCEILFSGWFRMLKYLKISH